MSRIYLIIVADPGWSSRRDIPHANKRLKTGDHAGSDHKSRRPILRSEMSTAVVLSDSQKGVRCLMLDSNCGNIELSLFPYLEWFIEVQWCFQDFTGFIISAVLMSLPRDIFVGVIL